MNDDHRESMHRTLGLEPTDLDGHTLEELTDYLESGRRPVEPSIEESPGCQLALDALERLQGLGDDLMEADTAAAPEADENWVDRILNGIALDARAGRRIPFESPDPDVDLAITEGAVRGIIRSAENAVPGVLVGRCRLDGDVAVPAAPIRIEIEANVFHGQPIPSLAERLRAEVLERLGSLTELNIVAVDIVIRDLQEVASWTERKQ